jgi:hypothetical protein
VIVVLGGPFSRVERIGLAVALALAATLMWPVRDHAHDAAYVWLQYARHLAQGRGLVFNAGEHVYGMASPLWVALIADGMMLGLNGPWVARALGVIATLVSVVLFLQLMRRTVGSPVLRAVSTVAWAGQATMAQWSCAGVETPLAVALVLAGFVAFTEGQEWGERPVRTGALWALAALTRPGSVLLIVLYGTLLLVDAKNRPGLRRLVFGVAPALIIYGSWLAFARFYYGTFWPQSMSLHGLHGGGWRATLVNLLAQGRLAAPTEGVIGVAFLAAAMLGGARLWTRQRSALHYLPWMWVVLLPVLLASRGIAAEARHVLLVAPIAHWLTWRAVEVWWRGEHPSPHVPTRTAALACVLGALVLAQNLYAYKAHVVPDVRATTAQLRGSVLVWGPEIARETPRATTLASPVIGALAYTSGRHVLDLSGYVSPAMLPVLRTVAPQDLVATLAFRTAGRPDYVVDAGPPEPLLARSPYRAALSVVRRGEALSLYRVDWARVDSLDALP